MRDLMSAAIKSVSSNSAPGEKAHWSRLEKALLERGGAKKESAFEEQKVHELVNASRTDIYAEFSPSTTLDRIASAMVKQHLHRVAIVNNDKKIDRIVSASDVLVFLAEHDAAWAAVKATPIKQLFDNGRFVEPITVTEDSVALNAFQIMVEKHISGVAVVNAGGQLVANLSHTDIKFAGDDEFVPKDLFLTVKAFLLKKSRDRSARAPIGVGPEATLETVLFQLAMFRVHRCWIVDRQQKPIGIITSFDILKYFAQ